MKRVIRYDHAMYNTLLRYSATHGFYRYFGFEKRHPSRPLASRFASAFLFLISLREVEREIVSPREKIHEVRRSRFAKETGPHGLRRSQMFADILRLLSNVFGEEGNRA